MRFEILLVILESGAKLSEENECILCSGPGSSLSDNGSCVCSENSKMSISGTLCISCFGPTAFLDVDDRCSCASGHVMNGSDECVPCAGPGAELVNGKCTCDPEFSILDEKETGTGDIRVLSLFIYYL